MTKANGSPLEGLRVVEFEALGPAPMAGRLLADFGATVTVIARPLAGSVMARMGEGAEARLREGKSLRVLDLKAPADRLQALEIIGESDVLIEGNRPGVMERLGLGPRDCAARNPQLIYGRLTGWGQDGPRSQLAGHDLNFVALSGLLSLAGPAGTRPTVPPTVLGDAAGALSLAFGILAAVLQARASGRGRVVDAAILDATALQGRLAQWLHAAGQLHDREPGIFQGSPFYDTYRCSDGGHVAIGALEPPFYAALLRTLGLHDVDPRAQYEQAEWPLLKRRIEAIFAAHPRAHWEAVFEGSDACFAPVLDLSEAARHPHNQARGLYREVGPGAFEACPAPRLRELD